MQIANILNMGVEEFRAFAKKADALPSLVRQEGAIKKINDMRMYDNPEYKEIAIHAEVELAFGRIYNVYIAFTRDLQFVSDGCGNHTIN